MNKELLLLIHDESLENDNEFKQIEQAFHAQNKYNLFKSNTESFLNNLINLKDLFYKNTLENVQTNIIFIKKSSESFNIEEQLLTFKNEFSNLNIGITYLDDKLVYYPLIEKLKKNNIKVLIKQNNMDLINILTNHILVDNVNQFNENIHYNKSEENQVQENENAKRYQESQNNRMAKIITISSPKPGSGKSFIASNIAVALADKDYKVCLIEGDFQTTSVYNNFKVEINPKYNIYTAIKFVKNIMINENKNILDFSTDNHREVLKFLQQCILKKYNISILAMPHVDINHLEEVDANIYYYLINLLGHHFNYLIIDSNSSLSHETTIPILALSDKIIYLITLNENSIKNAANYKLTINQLGEKVNIANLNDKFYEVLNESSKDSFYKNKIQKIKNSKSFNIVGEISEINKKDFNFAIDNGKPLYLEKATMFSKLNNKDLKEFKKGINNLIELIEE